MNSNHNYKNKYFIEGATTKDIIGFKSYIDALENAITSGAKFIGIISDFGTGKSSLIKMLEVDLKEKYKIISINLWNCDNTEDNTINVHQAFLYQLIEELNISPKNYYKNKINKNYRSFDISFGYKNPIFFIFLFSFLVLLLFDKLAMINLFICDLQKFIAYFLFSVLVVLCIIIYKPMLSFSKENTSRKIDENDTKSLYTSIMQKYFKNKQAKPLIISLEEIDRYDKYDEVIKYLKEFYKFYKLSEYNIIFIMSIKPSSKMISKESAKNYSSLKNLTKEIKDVYEKIFDFILNLNTVNIDDYGEILPEIINEESLVLPENIDYPNQKNIKKWRYLYQGNRITIRDIKHRINFAISLYNSVKESNIPDPDFYKCIFISYLEDDYNELYEFLIDNPKIFNDILGEFSINKNLDNYKDKSYGGFIIYEKYINILIEGIVSKNISFDYTYYFYKYPRNKKSYNMYELSLFQAIMFDEDSDMLKKSITKIDEKTIIEIMDKRKNITIYPKIIFEYPSLLKIVLSYDEKTLYNTLDTMYDLISNYSNFEQIFRKIILLNKREYLEIFKNYFKTKKDKINMLSLEEREQLRNKLVNLFRNDCILFDYLFFNDNPIISPDEMKLINSFETIKKITNYSKVDDKYVTNIMRYINNSFKTYVIEFLKEFGKAINITQEMFDKVYYAINFSNYYLTEKDIKDIYAASLIKLDLVNKDNLIRFITNIKHYNKFLNEKLIDVLDYSNKDDVSRYIKICKDFDYADKLGIEFIINSNYYFILPNKLLNLIYDEKHYSHYVVSVLMLNNKYSIDEEKFDQLKDTYIEVFLSLKQWKYEVDDKMTDYLFNNIDLSLVPIDRLSVFEKHVQSKKLIEVVINTNNHDLIKKYLKNIEILNKKEEKEIFEIIGNYYKEYGLDYRIRKKLISLTNDINIKNLLDGRRNR